MDQRAENSPPGELFEVVQDYLVDWQVMDGGQRVCRGKWPCAVSVDEFGFELRSDVAAYDALFRFLVSVFGNPPFQSDGTGTTIFRRDATGVTLMMAIDQGELHVIGLNWKDTTIRDKIDEICVDLMNLMSGSEMLGRGQRPEG